MRLNGQAVTILLLIFFQICRMNAAYAQIVINEASNKNVSQIADEDGEFDDWIELYNSGIDSISTNGLFISDDSLDLKRWQLPSLQIAPGGFLLLFASGKDRRPFPGADHWESIINDTSIFRWVIPDENTSPYWLTPDFNAEGWGNGIPGFGYGDGDDSTRVDSTALSIYLLKTFEIPDTSIIEDMILHMDYDDGFVAYLNGFIIAQNGFPGGRPVFNQLSITDHEALMYRGLPPEAYYLPAAQYKTILNQGKNILAIEVHNASQNPDDLSARPYLSFGVKDAIFHWSPEPSWFTAPETIHSLHTNFKIARKGENLILSDNAGIIIDHMNPGSIDINNSYGRKTDGSADYGVFTQATPGFSNNSNLSFQGYCAAPQIQESAGFYSNSVLVHLEPPLPGFEIRYTLNGQTPAFSDAVYAVPLNIDKTTVVKARYFDLSGNLLPGITSTSTFFINEQVSLPVISLSTDNVNLYGLDGIYDNWWTDWKKPCYIEYFDKSQVRAFHQHSGIKIDGGAGGSRSLPQRSFRLEPDHSAYGDGIIKYKLIPRKHNLKKYETFYLRNGSNMSNVLPYKDAYMTRTTEGTYNEFMNYTPVIVFLNGEYWGLYELREKLDEGHFKYADGIDPDSLDLLSMGFWYQSTLRALKGSAEDWIRMRDMLQSYPSPESNEFYSLADSVLDLKNFTDYMIAESWLANPDWPWNNIKIWRDKGGENKWKYGIIDVEWGLGMNAWSTAYSDMIGYILDPNQYYTGFFANLVKNIKYRNYFINRYADLMNSTFLPLRTLPMEDSMYQEIVKEFPRQLNRWGDQSTQTMQTFYSYRNALRTDMSLRSPQVRDHISLHFGLYGQTKVTLKIDPPESGRIRISSLSPEEFPWTGYYFQGIPIPVTGMPNEGYRFDHWEANTTLLNAYDSSNSATVYTGEVELKAVFKGSPAGKEITISEINYHPEASVDGGNWIEVLNKGSVPMNISHWIIQDSSPDHVYRIPSGVILQPDDRWVITDDTDRFRLTYPLIRNFSGNLGFGLGNKSDQVRLYDSLYNLKVIVAYDDSIPWPVGADGMGRTLELKSPLSDPMDPESWFEGCIGGSPGLPYTPCNEPVIFSEINYNSNKEFNTGDWVEIRNVSNNTVNIGGWIFMDDSVGPQHYFQIPYPLNLAPHSNWVLTGNTSSFTALNPSVTNFSGQFPFSLKRKGEWIRLYDSQGKLRQTMKYSNLPPWPGTADGQGYTLEILDTTQYFDYGTNWTVICEGGSPGKYPSYECTNLVGIPGEISVMVQPNPTFGNTDIRIDAVKKIDVIVQIFNSQGQLVKNLIESQVHEGPQYFTLTTDGLTKGLYFIIISSASEKHLAKLIIL
jgi:hypothetical protein